MPQPRNPAPAAVWSGTRGTLTANHTPLEEYWQLTADLKAEGKIRAIALSDHDAAQLTVAESIAHVDAVQPPFSAINRSAATDIAWAKEHGTGLIVCSPLQWPGVTGAIVGARTKAQVDGWAKAGAVRLTAQDLADIAEAIRTSGAGSGSATA